MGTAAAQDNETDQDADLDQAAANVADLAQEQNQANVNSLSGETGDAPLIQVQQTDQTNFGEQSADVEQGIEQDADLEQEIERIVQGALNGETT
ncbi:hypothetical protein Halxa_1484 [Halopiger xanaduensis SH-6]|uniref:Uncharacterized protein n=2 Tax=Halopiger xanaduensis TaxID=387343 RepID=F8D2X4_HALXS|nr:hypothetical protein Halxa_1484 [Halopiger xanaduensis SH-6]